MPLTATFLADFSSFLKACADANTSTDELVESAGHVGKAMDDAVTQAASSVKSVGDGIANFGKATWQVLKSDELANFGASVKTFVSGYIAEFAGAEAATARLQTAVQNSGADVDATMAKYADMATQLQKTSTFADEDITDAIANFTQFGKIGPESMDATIRAAMELAAFMKTDVVTASGLMMKAAQSGGEELGKLKKVLGDSVPEGAKFADIVGIINEKLSGNVASQLNTTAGAMQNLKNQMSDINEAVGEQFAGTLQKAMDLFRSLPEGVQTFAIAIVAIGTAVAPVVTALSGLISLIGGLAAAAGVTVTLAGLATVLGVIGAALAALFAVWYYWDDIVEITKKAYTAISGWLTGLVDGLKNLYTTGVAWVHKLYEGIKAWLVDKLGALFEYIATLPASPLVAFVKFHADIVGLAMNIYTGIKTWLVDKLMGIVDAVGNVVGKVVGWFKWAYDEIVGHSIVPDLVIGTGMWIGRLDKYMVKPTQRSLEQVVKDFNIMYDAIKMGFDVIDVKNGIIKYAEGKAPHFGATRVSAAAAAAAGGVSGAGSAKSQDITVNVNMTGMLGTDDPQTRAQVRELVSNAVMEGMRGSRLMGTT